MTLSIKNSIIKNYIIKNSNITTFHLSDSLQKGKNIK